MSDTHGFLEPKALKYFQECDEIWHAGDIGDISITDELEQIKPVKAVYGNIDGDIIRRVHPKNQRFFCENVDVWMTHIGGKPYAYSKDVKESIYSNPPKLFICGHSHILKVQFDKKINCLYINPGACGKKGFHKVNTIIRFTIDNDRIFDLEVIELGKRV